MHQFAAGVGGRQAPRGGRRRGRVQACPWACHCMGLQGLHRCGSANPYIFQKIHLINDTTQGICCAVHGVYSAYAASPPYSCGPFFSSGRLPVAIQKARRSAALSWRYGFSCTREGGGRFCVCVLVGTRGVPTPYSPPHPSSAAALHLPPLLHHPEGTPAHLPVPPPRHQPTSPPGPNVHRPRIEHPTSPPFSSHSPPPGAKGCSPWEVMVNKLHTPPQTQGCSPPRPCCA